MLKYIFPTLKFIDKYYNFFNSKPFSQNNFVARTTKKELILFAKIIENLKINYNSKDYGLFYGDNEVVNRDCMSLLLHNIRKAEFEKQELLANIIPKL